MKGKGVAGDVSVSTWVGNYFHQRLFKKVYYLGYELGGGASAMDKYNVFLYFLFSVLNDGSFTS